MREGVGGRVGERKEGRMSKTARGITSAYRKVLDPDIVSLFLVGLLQNGDHREAQSLPDTLLLTLVQLPDHPRPTNKQTSKQTSKVKTTNNKQVK